MNNAEKDKKVKTFIISGVKRNKNFDECWARKIEKTGVHKSNNYRKKSERNAILVSDRFKKRQKTKGQKHDKKRLIYDRPNILSRN